MNINIRLCFVVILIICYNINPAEKNEQLAKCFLKYVNALKVAQGDKNMDKYDKDIINEMGKGNKAKTIDDFNKITNKITDLNKYLNNETFKANYKLLSNCVKNPNDIINIKKEIINNMDIYGDILSNDIDPAKLLELFKYIKSYDDNHKKTSKEVFKNKFIKEILRSFPLYLSIAFLDTFECLSEYWEKIPKEIRGKLEQYIKNALHNICENFGLNKLSITDLCNQLKESKLATTINEIFKEIKNNNPNMEENLKKLNFVPTVISVKDRLKEIVEMAKKGDITQGIANKYRDCSGKS